MLAVFTCNSAHLAQRQQGRALAIQVVTMTLAALSNVALIAFCKLGIAGAALASVVTQYAAAGMQLLSLWQLRRRGGIRLSLRAASWSRAEETLSRLGPLSVMYLAKVRSGATDPNPVAVTCPPVLAAIQVSSTHCVRLARCLADDGLQRPRCGGLPVWYAISRRAPSHVARIRLLLFRQLPR